EVPASARTLIFSSSEFTTREVDLDGRSTVDLTLSTKVGSMDEIVVVGYSSVRRKDLTGSVSSVSAKQLKDVPVASVAEAMQGRLAGVTAITAEGSPDADINIRVRGGMSITGDNRPLYVVDGVIVENAL